ncbi:DUF979 domain-containing protein [Tsuneonella amylolytica]|uniref:DUF979 domain-containing protein n=1 Tax=Tsuneonella amylolytica TaxID=2338327 RepID=UPI000EAA7B44|nr:DUF979 domain-containing protein [Tsuneonella amylolytica]
MIGLGFVYAVGGAVFLAYAILSATDGGNPKRWGNAAFYALLAASFWLGDLLGDVGNGVLVLGLVVVAGFKLMGRGGRPTTSIEERREEAARRGNRIFLPALIIPAVALAGTLAFKRMPGLFDVRQVTLVGLTFGVLLALAACYAWVRPRAVTPLAEGTRLMDSVGWAAVLPQMLASLGAVFALAGVGGVVGGIASGIIPEGSRMGAVVVYALGMAGFTMIMGNAFAAFPVMFAGVGMPVLVGLWSGDPIKVAAIGMLAGFCGTLMTPMAANFNLVPAALLELKDQNAVIKAQVPTAIPLLLANILLLYFLAFA